MVKTETQKIDIHTLLKALKPSHLSNLKSTAQPAFYTKASTYQLLSVRFFRLKENELVEENYNYVIENQASYRFDALDNSCTPISNHFSGLHRELEKASRKAFNLLNSYIEQIEELEDSVYDRSISRLFMDDWFDLKKGISRMERVYARTLFVLGQVVRANSEDESFPFKEFEELIEHVDHGQKLCQHHLVKLDMLYNYYTSLKSDKLNTNIYVLTSLSGVFLPLNFVVGYFGMNTQNLFFSHDPEGTTIVTFILFGLLFFMLIGIPVIREAESMILRRILGRYSFYRRMTRRMSKFMEVDINK